MKRRTFLSGAIALSGVDSTKVFASPKNYSTAIASNRPEFVIRNAYVMTMDNTIGDLEKGDVHVRQGEIVAVGTQLTAPNAQIINGQNTIVLPGLIDTHWHLWTALFRSRSGDTEEQGYFPLSERLGKGYTPEDVYHATRLATAEALFSGITTVHDFNHNIRTLEYAQAGVEALFDAGIRARFSYGYYKDQSPEEATPFSNIRQLQRSWNHQNRLLSLGFAPREISVYKQYRHDWEVARELQLPITVHASSSPSEVGEIEVMAKAGLLGSDVNVIHATAATHYEIEQLAKHHTSVTLTPLTEMRTGGFPKIRELLAAGVRVGVGVDTTVLAGNADMFVLMKTLQATANAQAESEFALPPRRILELATMNGAEILGISDRVGSLTPGKRADLIMVSTNSLNMSGFTNPLHLLVEATQPSNIELVMVDGQIVKREGKLTTIDVKQILQNANRSSLLVRRRSNL
jgi:cytosine/adenosine deaminase-related metal-dependent hydrolase